ncbi:class II aldolase/adducin family protein [Marinobacterium aestuariivivens]|uniref:Class II aldolase/adducin family protein n=1 Tax=Marinobacterium aestuariivivens TaxID=1698799 RepID=A0ABW2A8F7_9GAMM
MFELPVIDMQAQVPTDEWRLRVDLAACYRLVAHFGWDDLIYTHISARVPGSHHFLVNPFGLTFDEITASSLVKVDLDGRVLNDTPFSFNPAGFTIHSAIHEARDDARCVLHLHTNATIAVATQKAGLLPLSQFALFSLPSLGYHAYEGLAVNPDEKRRLQEDLGSNHHLLLRNHGALTVGPTVGDAFMRMYDLQRACEIQLLLLASKAETVPVSAAIVHGIAQQAGVVHSGTTGGCKNWPAMLRKAYRLDPGFAA